MTRYLDFLLPKDERYFALWLSFGTGLFTLVTWLGVPLWGALISAISPTTSSSEAVSGTWAFGLLLLEFVIVYFAVYFARRRGAPRWVWLPVAALGAWIALAELVVYGFQLAGSASSAPSIADVITSLVIGISPLVVIALPALLACMRTGHVDEPLLGGYREQPVLFAAAGLAVAAVGLPQEGLIHGWFAGAGGTSISILGVPLTAALVVWGFIVPALACWIATARFHMPRASWLPVAVGGLGVLLLSLVPTTWIENAGIAFSDLLVGLIFAVLTAGGAILGAWFGTRVPADSDAAGYIQG